MKTAHFIYYISLCFVVFSCGSSRTTKDSPADNDGMDLLMKWMTGSFDTEQQARKDPDYYNITMHIYPIWTDRYEGNWLYVEEAMSAIPQSPFRQRIFHIVYSVGKYIVHVYELPDPDKYIGKWIGGTDWDTLSKDDLITKKGCELYLVWHDGQFVGSTRGQLCRSAMGENTYQTSQIRVSEEWITRKERKLVTQDDERSVTDQDPYIFRPKRNIPD